MHQRAFARALGRAVCCFGFIGGGILAVSSPARANLTIVPTFDSTITSDPNAAAIEAGINAAIARVESHIQNPVTVTITFQGGNLNFVSGSVAAEALPDYTSYLNALKTAQILSANDNTALATLPPGPANPVNGFPTMDITTPLARALGLPTFQQGPDGTITLNTSVMNLSRTGPQNPNFYDLQAAAGHEIDEILGIGGYGSQLPFSTSRGGTIGPEDLFRYGAAGVRSLTVDPAATAYFSIDGGVTAIANFNQSGAGDYGDWASSATPRIQDAFAPPGVQIDIGPAELTALDVIGWDLAPVPEPASLSVMALGMLGLIRRRGRRQQS